jgi:alkylation response protein AidB-like acyl-CoA dehydrogenase
MSAAQQIAARPDPVSRARALAPVIAAAADRIEAAAELPADLLDALHEAALFRALLPRSQGGDEARPADFVRMMETIAAADASTAWCIGQNSGCSMAAAYLDPVVARKIWGDDPRAALAWGAGPQGKAHVVPGGYRVTGTWEFASGGRHATWFGGHSRIVEPDGTLRRWADGPLKGELVERSMLFPRAAVMMVADWNPLGLRGTGSDRYSVTDLFVPEEHTLCRDHAPERREPGTLYRFTTTNLYAAGFGAVALGIASAMLDAFTTLARDKTPQASTRTLRDSPHIQVQTALATAKLRAARALLLDTLERIWDAVAARGALTLDERMDIRLAATFGTHQAREVGDFAYHEAGATAIFPSQPFERRFRDLHTVTQQVQARSSHFETVGAHLLGLSPPLRFV